MSSASESTVAVNVDPPSLRTQTVAVDSGAGITLRSYQTLLVEEARASMLKGHRSVLIQAPTGSGKTALCASMLHRAVEKGRHCWFVVHRRELIMQACRAFDLEGIPHGVISAGFVDEPWKPVQVCSIQTLVRRYHKLKSPQFICFDEAHHLAAKSWARIYRHYPGAYKIGLTATPERLDGKGLRDWFSTIICGPSAADLIADGWLAPYRLFAPPGISVRGLHTRMGDYAKDELAAAADRPSITGCALAHYQKIGAGRRAVAFCCSVKHSKNVAAQFNEAGIMAAHVDGDTPKGERDDAVARFSSGEILLLSNVDLFGEGFDLPELEIAILLRPTQSLSMYLQQCGRALRPAPGKQNAVILDHAGNASRHGLPDDDRTWTLNDREKKSDSDGPVVQVRICQHCFAACRPGCKVCPFCGMPWEVKYRQVANVDGKLEEVDAVRQRMESRIEQGRAKTEEELVALGIARGYKRPRLWARHVIMARARKTAQ